MGIATGMTRNGRSNTKIKVGVGWRGVGVEGERLLIPVSQWGGLLSPWRLPLRDAEARSEIALDSPRVEAR